MGDLTITAGDLHFRARWESAAPRTIEAIRGLLPLRSQFIHVRWSGRASGSRGQRGPVTDLISPV